MMKKILPPERVITSKAHIRVLIADDNPLIRCGLQSILSTDPYILLVAETNNGEDMQNLCLKYKPDVLLLDLHLLGSSLKEIVTYVHKYCPATRILILTTSDDETHIRELIKAKISGYLSKEESPTMIVQAIHTVMQGCACFSSSMLERLEALIAIPLLTPREQEIVQLLALGHTDQKIGFELGLSERTIRYHLRKIYEKLGVKTRVEAAVQAAKRGWIRE